MFRNRFCWVERSSGPPTVLVAKYGISLHVYGVVGVPAGTGCCDDAVNMRPYRNDGIPR